MSQNDFQILNAAFENAIELTDDERLGFLNRFRARYPLLAERLQHLLDSDADDRDLLRSWIDHNIADIAKDKNSPWIGEDIDKKWRVIEHIGSGGMGTVFLAERVDGQFAQTVAIKVLSTQLLHSDATQRFRSERQILANLNHPNIATLMDGGTTDTGLPYLVMEYVDGVALDVYCQEQDLKSEDILKLLITVCKAVDYAHRELVIHRDLKPENILVTAEGAPKLLDFGIAKLLEPTGMSKGETTRALTPEYASPEQVLGENVTAATDVYALGVNLYRLMSGHSPYGDKHKTWEEVETAILEYEPARPSTLSFLSGENSDDAFEIMNRFKYLDAQAKEDLDLIILKCLQKTKDQRYRSAHELAQELIRLLKHEPVEVRAGGWFYKARKFVQRHFRLVIGIATAVLMIAGLSFIYQQRVKYLDEKVAEVESVNIQLIAPIFRPPEAQTSESDVDITGFYRFEKRRKDGKYQVNEFQMLNEYTLQVRSTDVEQEPNRRWFVYIRIGPKKFQAKYSTATYTLSESGNLLWESDRRNLWLVPTDKESSFD